MIAEATKSTHRAEVVPVALEKHPSADSLSVVRVYGYTCCVRSEDWRGVSRAVYVPPDSLVDVTRPEFAFLADQAKGDGKARIKAKKLRGVVSFGLLVPAPDDAEIGDDLAEALGVEHYEPPLKGAAGEAKGSYLGGVEDEQGPAIHAPKYDVDAFRRYASLFEDGEPVVVTEKLDGANCRFVFHDGRMHCGSRTQWKREFADTSHITREHLAEKGCPEDRIDGILAKLAGKPARRNAWWDVLDRTPGLETFCRRHPGTIVFGELYGNVNCIKYGLPEDRFAAFDVLSPSGRYFDPQEAYRLLDEYGVPTVPLLNPIRTGVVPGFLEIVPIPYAFDAICEMAEGETLVDGAKPGTIREGVVVSPVRERFDPHLGRVKLKAVSGAYLEKYR